MARRKLALSLTVVAALGVGVAAGVGLAALQTPHNARVSHNKDVGRGAGRNQSPAGAKATHVAGANANSQDKQTAPKNAAATEDDIKSMDSNRKRIERAVATHQLTDDQAKLLNTKLDELEQFYKDIADKPKAERLQLIDDKETELRRWSSDNDVSYKYVRL